MRTRLRIRWADTIAMLGTSVLFAWVIVYALDRLAS